MSGQVSEQRVEGPRKESDWSPPPGVHSDARAWEMVQVPNEACGHRDRSGLRISWQNPSGAFSNRKFCGNWRCRPCAEYWAKRHCVTWSRVLWEGLRLRYLHVGRLEVTSGNYQAEKNRLNKALSRLRQSGAPVERLVIPRLDRGALWIISDGPIPGFNLRRVRFDVAMAKLSRCMLALPGLQRAPSASKGWLEARRAWKAAQLPTGDSSALPRLSEDAVERALDAAAYRVEQRSGSVAARRPGVLGRPDGCPVDEFERAVSAAFAAEEVATRRAASASTGTTARRPTSNR